MPTTYDRTYVDASGYEHRYPMHDHADDETVECLSCGRNVPGCPDCPNAPPAEDDSVWEELAPHHADSCQWIATMAFQR